MVAIAVAKIVDTVATKIPVEAEPAPVHHHAVGVERIKDQYDDGQIKKDEESNRPGSEPAIVAHREYLLATAWR
jgi:hypothetical protein